MRKGDVRRKKAGKRESKLAIDAFEREYNLKYLEDW
jgi:hypothetical protein